MYGFRDKNTRIPAVHLQNVFKKDLIENMITQIIDQVPAQTGTHSHKGKLGFETDKRVSTVRWFMDLNFENILRGAIDIANYIGGWRYDIVAPEVFQFTEYQPGGHYDWHPDAFGDHHSARTWSPGTEAKNLKETNNPKLLGTVRKISASVILNDDYEGGELEFKTLDDEGKLETTSIKPTTGSVVVFPSYVIHRVAPVTKGTRYSVVAWYGGPPLK